MTLILRGILVIVGGILWGFLWFSLIHAVPYFYLVAPAVDIAVYGLVGAKINAVLYRSGLPIRSQKILGILAMILFYLGNRIIWHGWIAHVWPFNFPPIRALLYEFLVILVALSTVTGLWRRRRRS